MQQSRLVLPSPLALPCLIALACLCTVHLVWCGSRLVWVVSSCVTMPHCVGMPVYGASRLGWEPLLQGACSQTEKHIHGEKVRQKIATKTTPAERGGHCPLVHTALWRASHAFGKWAQWHDECIVGDEVRERFRVSSGGWGRGKWSRLRANLSNSSG